MCPRSWTDFSIEIGKLNVENEWICLLQLLENLEVIFGQKSIKISNCGNIIALWLAPIIPAHQSLLHVTKEEEVNTTEIKSKIILLCSAEINHPALSPRCNTLINIAENKKVTLKLDHVTVNVCIFEDMDCIDGRLCPMYWLFPLHDDDRSWHPLNWSPFLQVLQIKDQLTKKNKYLLIVLYWSGWRKRLLGSWPKNIQVSIVDTKEEIINIKNFSLRPMESPTLQPTRMKWVLKFQVKFVDMKKCFLKTIFTANGASVENSHGATNISRTTEVHFHNQITKFNDMQFRILEWTLQMMLVFTFWMRNNNKLTQIVNGNGFGGPKKQITIISQNLNGNLSVNNKTIAIEEIFRTRRPHILCLQEPRRSELETIPIQGYNLISGNSKNVKDPRVNAYIHSSLQVEVLKFETEIPSLLLKLGDSTKLLFYYREWRVDGKPNTDSWPMQEARFRTFCSKFRKLKGRVFATGDMNISYWKSDTPYLRKQAVIKDLIMEHMIQQGYCQVIQEDTHWHHNGTSGCLDHLYVKNCQYLYTDSVQVINQLGIDHAMIYFKISLEKPAFTQQVIEARNINKLDPEAFDVA